MSPETLSIVTPLKLLLLLVVSHTFAVVMVEATTPFTMSLERQEGDNLITLRCENSQLREEGTFYLNNTVLDSDNFPDFMDTINEVGRVRFTIERSLEGSYTCGNENERSDSRELIVFPIQEALPLRPPQYELIKDTAIIACSVPPGRLLRQYAVRWFNGTRLLYEQPLYPSDDPPTSVDPRYSLDPNTLSLMIDKVQFSDANVDYRCEMRVVDPRSMQQYTYSEAERLNISLVVLAAPKITYEPEATTTRDRTPATFTCQAHGYPLPSIMWKHNGEPVTEQAIVHGITPGFSINTTMNSEEMTTTSVLSIASTRVEMSGEVECVAHATPPTRSTVVLRNDRASAPLTVLGGFNSVDVLISTNGDVIYLIKLPLVYSQPVKLYLQYTNAADSSQKYDRVTNGAFLNTTSIYYVEYSSQVYYDRFRVKVALMSDGVLGDRYEVPKVIDKTKTSLSLCDQAVEMSSAVAIGLVPAVFLFTVCILLIVGIIVIIVVSARIISNLIKKRPDSTSRVNEDGGEVVDPEKVEDIPEAAVNSLISKSLNRSTVAMCVYGPYLKRSLTRQP